MNKDATVNWESRGKTIAGLIQELQSFENQNLEVRISTNDGETTHCISLVAKLDNACVLINCEECR